MLQESSISAGDRQTHLAHGLVLLLPLRLALLLALHRRRRGAVRRAHASAVLGCARGDLLEERPAGRAGPGSPLHSQLSDAHGRRRRLVQVPKRRGLAEQHRPSGAAHRVGRVKAMAHPLGEARELGVDGVAHRPAQDGADHRGALPSGGRSHTRRRSVGGGVGVSDAAELRVDVIRADEQEALPLCEAAGPPRCLRAALRWVSLGNAEGSTR